MPAFLIRALPLPIPVFPPLGDGSGFTLFPLHETGMLPCILHKPCQPLLLYTPYGMTLALCNNYATRKTPLVSAGGIKLEHPM
jgi:hypothetical protein